MDYNYPSQNKKKPVKGGISRKAEEAVRAFRTANMPDNFGSNGGDNIQSDVMGSYTGTSYDGGDPEQDADDL
ncbi:MAG: hypothetical protein FWH10_01960 [Oscillospiraceae bacterium]|nr:hypothetical protein [Oscillospiraceae bacterium]